MIWQAPPMRYAIALLLLSMASCAGCEPEIGSPCSDDTPFVNQNFTVEGAENKLQRNVNYTNCSQALCLSVQGSRPFCTKTCSTDLDCNAEGFSCGEPILTGPFGCFDYEDNGDSCVGSEVPRRYCTADPGTIEKRDRDLNRDLSPESNADDDEDDEEQDQEQDED